MELNEFEKRKTCIRSPMNLDSVDKALYELGMLSAITEARRDYLRKTNPDFSVVRLNRRYVSKVSVGYWMKRTPTKNRLCPYVVPLRHRTKSENSDTINSDVSDSSCDFKSSLLEPSTSSCCRDLFDAKSPAKRCQSLENLNLSVDPPPDSEISPDMDCVSTQIQKLQVDE